MIRLILLVVLFLLSLVNIFPVPSKETWYAGIAVPEFPWVFILAVLLLFIWSFFSVKFKLPCLIIGTITLIILSSPIARAYMIGNGLEKNITNSFGVNSNDIKGFHQAKPFSFLQMFTGNGAKKIPFKTFQYALHEGVDLTLNFSSSAIPGIRPCLVVVHGGSWRRGDNSEIAAVNNYFANAGYQVATINYRLAPKFHSPAPQDDVHAALTWLRSHAAELKIDTNNFVLTGRSAGAQIVLTTAYTGKEHGVKGVAAFYGPNDMLWSYNHPTKMPIMDSRLVQRDFLGGSPSEVPERYFAESPLFHVTSQTVPTLLVHGKNDAHVYYEQSVRLTKKLNDFKVNNMLLSLPWATHGCEYNLNGPSGQLSIYAMERFFYSVTQAGR
ncbi:MAG: alpha/beta hydrolase [Chitinophagaceae bacterium]|nr:alpha/beta hydrolase [Chitinophagaceae bacterium]